MPPQDQQLVPATAQQRLLQICAAAGGVRGRPPGSCSCPPRVAAQGAMLQAAAWMLIAGGSRHMMFRCLHNQAAPTLTTRSLLICSRHHLSWGEQRSRMQVLAAPCIPTYQEQTPAPAYRRAHQPPPGHCSLARQLQMRSAAGISLGFNPRAAVLQPSRRTQPLWLPGRRAQRNSRHSRQRSSRQHSWNNSYPGLHLQIVVVS